MKLFSASLLTLVLTACGSPILDPQTGEVIPSEGEAATGAALEVLTPAAPGLVEDATDGDGLSTNSVMLIVTSVMAGLGAGYATYRKRQAAKARQG